jgi:hypothetical protein
MTLGLGAIYHRQLDVIPFTCLLRDYMILCLTIVALL